MSKDSQNQKAPPAQDVPAAQAALLAAALPDLAVEGFTESVLDRAVVAAGLAVADKKLAFPRGALDLAAYFVASGTDAMAKQLADMDLASMKIRARITQAVHTRLAIDAPNKPVARHAFYFLAQPAHAKIAAKLLAATVDAMWRAAGDMSTDGNFYSKRAILSGVYVATRFFWLNDDSPDHRQTRDFLDRRIENVMQFEAGKARFRDLKKRLPDALGMLARWRYGEKR